MNFWYKDFLSYRERKEVKCNEEISLRYNISDGINHLPMPELYRVMISQSIIYANNISGYTQSAGHPLLVRGIQYYERVLAGLKEDDDGFADYVRITAGASAAIQMCISFYANKGHTNRVLISGMSYYLFMKSCIQNGLDYEVICSENGLLPLAQDLCAKISRFPGSLIILTLPANPTGEIYKKDELASILYTCRDNDCMVILDTCQYDELIGDNNFLNINELIKNLKVQYYVIVIGSFSKIRNLAGARIGYVITQISLLADYIEYCNEMIYFNHPIGFENAIITDLFYRTILRTSGEMQKIHIKKFRNIILQTVGMQCYQDVFKAILRSNTLGEDASNLKNDILANMLIVNNNYKYCKEQLDKRLFRISKLDGGYNFCIRIPFIGDVSEEEYVRKLSLELGTGILSQEAFGLPHKRGEKYLWIRISAAIAEEQFKPYITKLEKWGKECFGGDEKNKMIIY